MKTYELKAEMRSAVGKRETKAIRNAKRVPCVMYGGGSTQHFSVLDADLRKLINTPNVYIVNLTIDDKKHMAVIHEIQYHPVLDNVRHIDFYEIFEDKAVTIGIPVKLEGFAIGVKSGGKLQQLQRRIRVKAMISDLPDSLTVNVENLSLGKVIKVGELSFDNLELLDSANSVIASVKLTRAARGAASDDDAPVTTAPADSAAAEETKEEAK